jgi:hypothetical protein
MVAKILSTEIQKSRTGTMTIYKCCFAKNKVQTNFLKSRKSKSSTRKKFL